MYVGLNFKLDIGLYQLDQQVACQRYRQNFLDANNKVSELAKAVDVALRGRTPSLAFAA